MHVDFAQLEEAGVRLAPPFRPGVVTPPLWVDVQIADLSEPTSIVDAVTTLVGGIPPGWSLFDVEFSFTSRRLRFRFEPLLERRLVEHTQSATAARQRSDDALAEANAQEDKARRAYEKLLARGNREKPQPTVSVAGLAVKSQNLSVSD